MDQDNLITRFCDVTGADPEQAGHFLEATNWNLELATAQFFEGNEEEEDLMETGTSPHVESDDEDDAHYPPSARASTSKSKAASKFATLGDLRSKSNDDEEDSEDEKQDLFTGGEKSGLAVQNPGDPRKGGGIIQDILKRAAEGGSSQRAGNDEVEPGPSRPRFSGTGRTLGSDDSPSIEIPDPTAPRAPPVPTVTRTLTFWRDGFSVEDGPLMRYDDPANQEVLRAIQNGRAPLSLMNVAPGQPADVNVFRRLEEDYVPPKKKHAPFSGQGNRLGSPTPGGESSTSVPAPATTTPAARPAAPAPSVNVDASLPTTTLQIRLGDGTRLVSRFNHTHTVGDLYGFVNSSSLESRSRNYILQTTFPNKELNNHEQTIKEAGLVNAVVVQKWT